MATRTEVETLNARISTLREKLYDAVTELAVKDAENAQLKRKLHRKWNGRRHPYQCPICQRYVRLLEAELDMNDQILYVVGECKAHGRVTPTGRYTIDDLKAAMP